MYFRNAPLKPLLTVKHCSCKPTVWSNGYCTSYRIGGRFQKPLNVCSFLVGPCVTIGRATCWVITRLTLPREFCPSVDGFLVALGAYGTLLWWQCQGGSAKVISSIPREHTDAVPAGTFTMLYIASEEST